MRNPGAVTWLSSALMLGGTAVLGWHVWTLREAATAQRLAKTWLNRTAVADRSTPPPVRNNKSIRRGDVIGELSIPRLQISVMVLKAMTQGFLNSAQGIFQGLRFRKAAATSESPRTGTRTSGATRPAVQ